MNRQRTSLFLSLLIHGVLLASLYAVSSSSAWQSAPVVIDFDVASGSGGERGSGTSSPEPCAPRPAGGLRSPRLSVRVANQPKPARTPLSAPATPPTTPVEQNGPAATTAPPKRETVAVARAEGEGVASSGSGHSPSPGQGGNGASGGRGGSGSGSGGANGGGASADQLRNRYLKEHFTYIRDLIQKNISYPARARKFGWVGKVVVCFIVQESGGVSNERVVSSSGYELLDSNVISTIREVSPFPRPPVKAELRIPIVYSLE